MNRFSFVVLALLIAPPLPLSAATTATYLAAAAKTAAHAPGKTVTLPDGLKYTELKVGKGAMPRAGQTAVVHYTGTFPDGKKFDSSRDRGQPFEFTVGGLLPGIFSSLFQITAGTTTNLPVSPLPAWLQVSTPMSAVGDGKALMRGVAPACKIVAAKIFDDLRPDATIGTAPPATEPTTAPPTTSTTTPSTVVMIVR